MPRRNKRTRRGRRQGGNVRKLLRSNAFINAVARARNPERSYIQYDLTAKTVDTNKAANPIYWYIEGVIGLPSYMKAVVETAGHVTATDADTESRTFHIYDNKMKATVKNNEINPVNLELYFCVCRDKQYESATNTARDSLQEAAIFELVFGWTQLTSTTIDGLYANAAANTDLWDSGDTEFHTSYPHLTPFDSKNFCMNYKIAGVKKLRLAPGEAIVLNQKCKAIDWQDGVDDTTFKMSYPGVTKFILVKQYGDLGTTAADAPGYTVSQTIWEKTYRAKWNTKQDSDRQLGAVNNVTLPADGTAILGPTEVVMDDV